MTLLKRCQCPACGIWVEIKTDQDSVLCHGQNAQGRTCGTRVFRKWQDVTSERPRNSSCTVDHLTETPEHYEPTCQLHSSFDTFILCRPSVRTRSFGQRSFLTQHRLFGTLSIPNQVIQHILSLQINSQNPSFKWVLLIVCVCVCVYVCVCVCMGVCACVCEHAHARVCMFVCCGCCWPVSQYTQVCCCCCCCCFNFNYFMTFYVKGHAFQ